MSGCLDETKYERFFLFQASLTPKFVKKKWMHLGVNFQKVGVEGRMIENLCGEGDDVRGGGDRFS